MIFSIEVGVCLRRPVVTQQFRYYRVDANEGSEAELLACMWAASAPGVVMPTESLIVDWNDVD